ncbi:hypothetical protein QUF58_03015, partial [Anaerolineales bacterium HSG24]|nr:hypothetical protein [Anaerolineales bacterium HSG24]
SIVIILTANDNVRHCRDAFKLGVTDYISKNWRDNIFAMVDKSIQEAMEAVTQRGNLKDEVWIEDNLEQLRANYMGQYVAVINHGVIESAETEEAVKEKLAIRKLPLFLTVIRKIEPPTDSVIEQLEQELAQNSQPVVYVEGKTDMVILQTAWQKLYGDETMPFRIISLIPDNQKFGAAGVGSLTKIIRAVRADSPQLVIGLFDRDSEGIKKGYNQLPKNFLSEDAALQAKIARNKKAAAFLLPIPQGRERHAEFENLCIEYLFSDAVLAMKTSDGKGLELVAQQKSVKVGSVTKQFTIEDSAAHQIKGNKKAFAEQIVPTLDKTEFEAFHAIFTKIERLIQHLEID